MSCGLISLSLENQEASFLSSLIKAESVKLLLLLSAAYVSKTTACLSSAVRLAHSGGNAA